MLSYNSLCDHIGTFRIKKTTCRSIGIQEIKFLEHDIMVVETFVYRLTVHHTSYGVLSWTEHTRGNIAVSI